MTDRREFDRAERASLRELAGDAYEAQARETLASLADDFERWRREELASHELIDAIHEFHEHDSRELWKTYQDLKDDAEIVARGIALGYLGRDELPPALLAKLQDRIAFYERFAAPP